MYNNRGAAHQCLGFCYFVVVLYFRRKKSKCSGEKGVLFLAFGLFCEKDGGLPIDRSRGANVIRQTIQLINEHDYVHLALTPEGTRAFSKKWKAGFHIIARETGIPVYLGSFDWGSKTISTGELIELTDDATADINRMKDYYREKGIKGKFPENFCTEHQ